MLHGASPDEAVSARGPIAIRYRSLLFGFLKSMISTEQMQTSFKNGVLEVTFTIFSDRADGKRS